MRDHPSIAILIAFPMAVVAAAAAYAIWDPEHAARAVQGIAHVHPFLKWTTTGLALLSAGCAFGRLNVELTDPSLEPHVRHFFLLACCVAMACTVPIASAPWTENVASLAFWHEELLMLIATVAGFLAILALLEAVLRE